MWWNSQLQMVLPPSISATGRMQHNIHLKSEYNRFEFKKNSFSWTAYCPNDNDPTQLYMCLMFIFIQPLQHRKDVTRGQFLSEVQLVWILIFSFSWIRENFLSSGLVIIFFLPDRWSFSFSWTSDHFLSPGLVNITFSWTGDHFLSPGLGNIFFLLDWWSFSFTWTREPFLSPGLVIIFFLLDWWSFFSPGLVIVFFLLD